MPLYGYVCECGHKQDEFHKVDHRDDFPTHCGKLMKRPIVPSMVNPDIQPYRTVAADKKTGKLMHIESRRQHKEFLARNDCVETG